MYMFVVEASSCDRGHLNKVSKDAEIRNRYNQVPHLTQDTNTISPALRNIYELAQTFLRKRFLNIIFLSVRIFDTSLYALTC